MCNVHVVLGEVNLLKKLYDDEHFESQYNML